MKIYVITEGEYSDYHIVALCEDKEKAECVAEKVCGEVEEYETKDADILCKKIPYYKIYMDIKTGKILCKPIQKNENIIMCFKICAQTKEKAIKIARDRWAKYKARANDVKKYE